MGILAMIVVGLIAGALAKMVVPGREPSGFWATLAIGIVGAIIGGFLYNLTGNVGATGVDVWSIICAFIGAVILLVLYHAVVGRRAV